MSFFCFHNLLEKMKNRKERKSERMQVHIFTQSTGKMETKIHPNENEDSSLRFHLPVLEIKKEGFL